MKDDCGTLVLESQMGGHHRGMLLATTNAQSRIYAAPTVTAMPGDWFYEMGGCEDSSAPSPSDPLDSMMCGNGLQHFDIKNLFNTKTVTETVDVPSSEHVAEIVGRQGCKIKALRAKTNTYIKTPVRGEEPVFMVTGRPEDVNEAKREIECAAEHFTQIRASRRHSQGGAPAPGHVTAYVRVPLRVVGLVVGPKGATIKRIQQDTHTYIITPSREREPIFEVTGLPPNVEAARKEIEQHIYQRTGNMPITDPSVSVGNFDLQGNMQPLSAAASAAVRSSYGSLAAGAVLRGHDNGSMIPDFMRQQQIDPATLAGLQLQGLGLLQQYPKAYSADASPPAGSPSLCNASRPQHTNSHTGYAQWSNAYTGLGIGAETGSLTASTTDLMGCRSSGTQSSMGTLSGLSLWSTPFISSSDDLHLLSNQRDEGLGDSPPNLMSEPYHLMSSIWNDLENPRDGPMTPAPPVDTATVYSSGISQ